MELFLCLPELQQLKKVQDGKSVVTSKQTFLRAKPALMFNWLGFEISIMHNCSYAVDEMRARGA